MVLPEKVREFESQIGIGKISAVMALVGFLLFTGTAVATTPADVVGNAIDSVIGQIAQVGSIILFLYGFFQLIKAGMSDERSGPLKKVAVSWILGIVVRSYQPFMDFVQGSGSGSGEGSGSGSGGAASTIRGVNEGTINVPVGEITHQTLSATVNAQDVIMQIGLAGF